jgi:hypothetical protein
MLAEPRRVRVDPDSELARLLHEAGENPIVLEMGGELYRLTKEEAWAGYDAAQVKTALDRTAGRWADLDADAMIAALYRARDEGSRPAARP